MKLQLFVSTVFVCCLAAPAVAENTPSSEPETAHSSRVEFAQLQRDHQAPQQYQAMAQYFQQRALCFQARADAEKKEWEVRRQNIVGPAAKYPRPVDSARYLYEYYAYEANHADALAAQYLQSAKSTQMAANH